MFVVFVQSPSRVPFFMTHGMQHVRLPCPSPSPRVCSSSCPLHQRCHATHPLSPFSAFDLSQHQGLFQRVGYSLQVAKVLELQLQHQSSSEYAGLISHKIDWFNLLAVQGTLRSLLQHHILKTSTLCCSAFFPVVTYSCESWTIKSNAWWIMY